MSKHCNLLTAAFIMSLWVCNSYAQERIISVDELFRLSDENSRGVQMSRTAVSHAAEAVRVARSAQLPSLDASLSFSYLGDGWISDRDFSNGAAAPMPHYGNNFSVEASQVIYGGGAIDAGIRSAELQKQIAELSLDDNRQAIRFLMLGYYLELFKLNNQRAVYIRNIEQTEILLEHIAARRNEGLALNNEITRYELQLRQLRLALTEVENSGRIINFQLVSTLSLPEGTVVVPDSTLLEAEMPEFSQAEWQNRAESNRPQLKMADISVSLNRQQERLTRSEKLPKIALVAANHFDGPIVIEVPPINRNFNYWYVGIGIQYNFGSLWKNGRKSRMNRYSTIRAEQNLELAREETGIAVNTAYIMLRQAQEQLWVRGKNVELAVQNYDVVNERYLNDLALITDMLDAANSQLSAQLSLVNARINVVYAYYKLQLTSGTL